MQTMTRGSLLGIAIAAIASLPFAARAQGMSDTLAAARMMAPGPEAMSLSKRAGTWNVVITAQLTPDAKPVITRGVIAERSMVGLYMQEIMKPAPGSKEPDFRRLAYITYSKVEGRWQYVSMDTRMPVGIMPAWSAEPAVGNALTLEFENIAWAGLGREVEGKMMHSNLVITRDSDDHDLSQQYFVEADGTGRRWLAVQYEYTRQH